MATKPIPQYLQKVLKQLEKECNEAAYTAYGNGLARANTLIKRAIETRGK